MDRRQQLGGGKGKEAMKGSTHNVLRLTPRTLHYKCPRCGSSTASFCYYNNYSLFQPRRFCQSCIRNWSHGGKLRNIPVGGGVIIGQNNNRARGPSPTPSSSSSTVAVAGPSASAVAAAGPSGGGVRRNNKRSRRPSSSSSSSSSTSSFCSSSSSSGPSAVAAAGPSAVAANVRSGVRQNNKRSRRASPSSSTSFTVAIADAAGPSNHQILRVKNNILPLPPNLTTRSSTAPTITEPPVPMTTSDPRPRPTKQGSSGMILGIGSTELPFINFSSPPGELFRYYNRPLPPNPNDDFGASNFLGWLKGFGLSSTVRSPPPPPPPPPPQQQQPQQQQYHYQYPPQVYRNMDTRGKAVINQPSQIPNMGRGKAVINQPLDTPMCIRGTVMPGTRGKTVVYHMSPLDVNMNQPSNPSISEQQAEWPPIARSFNNNISEQQAEWPPRRFNNNISEQQAEWPPRSFNNNISEQQAEWSPRSFNNNNTTSEAVCSWGGRRRRSSSSSSSSTAGSTTALNTTHPRNALNPTLPRDALNPTHPRESDDDLLDAPTESDHVVRSFHGPRTPTSSS